MWKHKLCTRSVQFKLCSGMSCRDSHGNSQETRKTKAYCVWEVALWSLLPRPREWYKLTALSIPVLSHWSYFPVVPSSEGNLHPQERVTAQLCTTGQAKTSLQAGSFMFCKQQWKEGCNLPELITSWATLLYKYWRKRRLLRFFCITFLFSTVYHKKPL